MRWVWAGLPIVPRCANDPSWPGQLHDVTDVPCCNYRPRPPAPTGDVRRLEYFDTAADAARGYDLAAVRWFGEFACPNFPREWTPERRWDVDIEWRQAKILERCRRLRYKKEKLKKAQEEEERKKQRREQRRKSDIFRKCKPKATNEGIGTADERG